jgi:hypothetical protein
MLSCPFGLNLANVLPIGSISTGQDPCINHKKGGGVGVFIKVDQKLESSMKTAHSVELTHSHSLVDGRGTGDTIVFSQCTSCGS